MVRHAALLGLAAVLLTIFGACGSDVVVSPLAAGAGGGEGGAEPVRVPPPPPPDACDAFDDDGVAICCAQVGCVWSDPGGYDCISEDYSCLYDEGDGHTSHWPCPDGFECVIHSGPSTPSECDLGTGEQEAAVRGFCEWKDRPRASPAPSDPCDAFDGSDTATCCAEDGCIWSDPGDHRCIRADHLCYYINADGKHIPATPCAPGFQCVIHEAPDTLSECDAGTTSPGTAIRGFCEWSGE